MSKRNPFYFFMLKRKEELESEGIHFPGGLVEVATHIDAEWVQMSEAQRAPYKRQSYNHNAALMGQKMVARKTLARSPSPEHSFKKFVRQIEAVAREEGWESECMIEIRDMLMKTIKSAELTNLPVLILNFSTYNDTPREALLLAEVGLSVFTIEDGVIENFSALIDPGPDIPEALTDSVTQSMVKLALPFPGYEPRAQDYSPILEQIFQIGKFYASYYDGVVTFHCLQKDWILTEICIKWLMFRADIYDRGLESEYNFLLVPLDVLIPFMCQNRVGNHGKLRQEDTPALKRTLAEMKFETERFYPIIPSMLLSEGAEGDVFRSADQVASYLDVDNFAYHEQLACPYHRVRQDGVYFCPLNLANRYAFNLLHVLVAPFKIHPRPGCHYPTLRTSQGAEEESARRLEMGRKWELYSPVGLGVSESEKDKELVEANEYQGQIEDQVEICQGWDIGQGQNQDCVSERGQNQDCVPERGQNQDCVPGQGQIQHQNQIRVGRARGLGQDDDDPGPRRVIELFYAPAQPHGPVLGRGQPPEAPGLGYAPEQGRVPGLGHGRGMRATCQGHFVEPPPWEDYYERCCRDD